MCADLGVSDFKTLINGGLYRTQIYKVSGIFFQDALI